jgi:hypothetical protein
MARNGQRKIEEQQQNNKERTKEITKRGNKDCD